MIDFAKLSLDIGLLRSGYRSGDFTPCEVVAEIYRRIAKPSSNPAWLHIVPETDAMRRAEEVGARLDLPLAGIPFAVKDNIDAAGIPTTAGCPSFACVPAISAPVVRLLEDAGAILIGKTNMDQFATGLVGTRSPHGACHSVFDPAYISGGSSSGSAVAVAGGFATFALGTDTAGSGRVPAAFNGLVGLKPTRGIVSTSGVVPACRSLDCVSVFALNPSDAATVLDVAACEDADDPFSRSPCTSARFRKPFRFGVPRAGQLEFCGDHEAAALYEKALASLEHCGGKRVEIDFTPFQETGALLYGGPWVAERYAAVGEFLDREPPDADPTVAAIIRAGARVSGAEVFRGLHRLADLRKRAAPIWAAVDVLALPTTPTIYRIEEIAADPVGLNAKLGTYTNFVNLLDLAAIAVPMGFRPDGLPLGLSLVGPACSDWELLRVAKAFVGTPSGGSRIRKPAFKNENDILLAVVGAHLTGLPLNGQLTDLGAVFVESVQTAPDYALFALDTDPPKPGMVRVEPNKGVCIEAELWAIAPEAFGVFTAAVPPPLCIGNVTLKDGRTVKGFLCEELDTRKAVPISAFGGWRDYLASLAPGATA